MTDECPSWKIPIVLELVMRVVLERQTPLPEDHPGIDDAIFSELLRRCWNYEPGLLTLPGPEVGVFGVDVPASLPTGTDVGQFEFSGRATGCGETPSIRPPTGK